MRDLTQCVEALTLPLSEPVDTVFSEIDDLVAIAKIANAPMTVTQKINMAYILFSKQHVYKSVLRKWDEQLDDHRNWESFKEHMHLSYKALKRTGALTIKDTLDHNDVMNMVTSGIQQAFATIQDSSSSPSPPPDGFSDNDSVPALEAVHTDTASLNSATSSISELTLQTLQQQMQMMQQMLHQMNNMKQPPTNTKPSRRNCNQHFYCWHHGA